MQSFRHDNWASLSHKAWFGDGTRRPGVQSWVPAVDARRLAAYKLLAAYRDNVVRYYLPDAMWSATSEEVLAGIVPPGAKYREYGHAGRLIIAARSALLGDEQTLHAPDVARADDTAGTDTPSDDQASAVIAEKALEWLRGWAKKERLWLKMTLFEDTCVGLGDAVWALHWDPLAKRPRLRQYDPGFYFPVLDDDAQDDYPRRVHIAWEEELPDGHSELHRLTWSLDDIRPLRIALDPFGSFNYLYTDAGAPVPQDGDRIGRNQRLERLYPWNTEHSPVTCHFTHAVWDLRDVKGELYDLKPEGARYPIGPDGLPQRDVDLRIDFLPILHQPNTPAGAEHYGQSVLSLTSQVLDDLSGNDTDLNESGALVGSATLVTEGGPGGNVDAGPGSTLNLPAGASAKYLDTSKNLDALLKLNKALKDTLSENSRVAAVTLGRTDASNAVSGIGLALSFSPTESLVRDLRQVRDEKYPLLLKFALRFAQNDALLAAGPTPEAVVQFGSFLPADQAQAVEQVTAALKARVMSTLTAVRTLQEAGFPIEDAQAEVERIQSENFEAAAKLLEALGDETAVAEYLGRQAVAEPVVEED